MWVYAQEESVSTLRQGPPPGMVAQRFGPNAAGHDWSKHLGRTSPLPLAPPDPTNSLPQVETLQSLYISQQLADLSRILTGGVSACQDEGFTLLRHLAILECWYIMHHLCAANCRSSL